MRTGILLFAAVVLWPGSIRAQAPAAARHSKSPQRVRLAPQFVPGQGFRYLMEFRTKTEGKRSGLIEDPEAPSRYETTWSAVVRVDVLGPGEATNGAAQPAGPGTRLRTTYEKSVASVRTDTYDPAAETIEEEYGKLEGRSMEFTLDAQGKIVNVEGLQGIVADPQVASAAREWFGQLGMGAALPKEGIVPGQSWSSEQPFHSAPLARLVWRAESTYLRNEPCPPLSASRTHPGTEAASSEPCAVILTHLTLWQRGGRRDPTPEEYRKHGLRTAGKWSGSGESLSYVSLRTGLLVSLTHSGTERMDVTVSTATGESSMRYGGTLHSQSNISLLAEAPPAPRKPQ